MGEVIALFYFTAKGKKMYLQFPFSSDCLQSVEIELINISIRHMFGPHATSTHF